MINKFPDHLTKEQQQAYQKAWLQMVHSLLWGIRAILVVIVLIMIYIPFANEVNTFFRKEKTIEKVQKPINLAELEAENDLVENGFHVKTGLKVAPGFDLVKANCTVCHSAKLITQNKASREGWEQMIDWMQETQGLWELGENEARILDYLAQHYAPEKKGRRENLNMAEIEWYILDLRNDE